MAKLRATLGYWAPPPPGASIVVYFAPAKHQGYADAIRTAIDDRVHRRPQSR
jgi:hypothetical protein